MQDLNALRTFVQVVDAGGFAAAARQLGSPKSTLSRRVAALEAQLGVRLLQRSSRRFTVTDIGQDFVAHCKAMLLEAEAAQQVIERTRAEPCGVVRLACPPPLLDARVGAMLAEFMVMHPRIELHLEATSRRVDVLAEGLDLALRVRAPPLDDSDLVFRVLGEAGQRVVASPSLIERHGLPATPDALSRLPSLVLGAPNQSHRWQLVGPHGVSVRIEHAPRLVTRDIATLRAAALAGAGVAQLPAMFTDADIAAGALVALVPDWAPPPDIVHVVFASRRGLLPSVRALLDFLVLRFEAAPRAAAGE
ncbi:MAG: LysR substrate-binding domain-containing protein [Lautropia sp.]